MNQRAEPALLAFGHCLAAGCVTGRLAGFSDAGWPLVDYEGNPAAGQPAEARNACPDLAKRGAVAIGAELLLQFMQGDPARPVVVGVMQAAAPAWQAKVDDEVLQLKATRRIELSCGAASIVLAADGKVVIKGAHLLSRSSGPNKIRGASVDIN
jgi:hypothetical protein